MNRKVSVLFNSNCKRKTLKLGPLWAVTYTVKLVISKKSCKVDTLLVIVWPIDLYHFSDLVWLWRSLACCVTYQMQFDEHLCNISHGFNWHGVSHGPTAIAELLVFYRLTAGFCTNVFCCIVWNLATAVELVMTCFVCIHDSARARARTHTCAHARARGAGAGARTRIHTHTTV